MLVDLIRYWIAGWIDGHFVDPAFLFKYHWLEWVQPLPRVGMYVAVAVMMVASVGVALGAAYRLAAVVLLVGHAYLYALAATHYLNHAYLLGLIALLMVCVPAADGLSIDAWRRPKARRGWVPMWTRWVLLAQLLIVYTFGGIAKLNADWLAGVPVAGWLQGAAKRVPEWMGTWLDTEVAVGLMVQGGLWFDLLVAPALLWRRTRVLAVMASLAFHLTNAYLFDIGVFPWFMLLATTLFFDPSWPRRLPWIGRTLDGWLGPVPVQAPVPAGHRKTKALLLGWLVFQLAMPLRHHLYPGNVAWTEQGHYYAWRMKLRSKSGSARFVLRAPSTGQSWVVDPADELTPWQTRKMVAKPDLVLQYAHHLAARWEREQGVAVEVRAQVNVSLNGRQRRPLVDPEVNLAAVEASLWPAPWIAEAPIEPVRRRRRRRTRQP